MASTWRPGSPVALAPDLLTAIITAVRHRTPELVNLTRSLVNCRTDSQTAGNAEYAPEANRCQDLVARFLFDSGLEVQQWVEERRYPVTAGRLPGSGGGQSLAINGHVDVVPVGDTAAWLHDPWAGEIAEGKLWGRGTTDMKSGVAAGMMAARVLRDLGVPLRGDLWLHVVADEEVVGQSTRRLIERLPRVDAVINAEPTDLRIMPTEGGLVHMRIEVEGRESHAGNRYASIHAGGRGDMAGINAIERLLKIVNGLAELEREWAVYRSHPMLPAGFNSIMPGVIAGGPGGGQDGQLNLISNPGTSPNYASVEYNIWWLPDESFESIRDEIERVVAAICETDIWLRAHRPVFTWKLRGIYFPAVDTPPDHPFIDHVREALVAVGVAPVTEAFTAASELAWYAEQGIAGTIFGPGRIAQAHSPNEYVEIEQLVTACTVMAIAAADWCA